MIPAIMMHPRLAKYAMLISELATSLETRLKLND